MLVYQRVDDRKRIELDEFPILFRIVIPGFFSHINREYSMGQCGQP